MRNTLFLLSMCVSSLANADCWTEASARYNVPTDALKAIAKVESQFNANAVNRNDNGTRDIGLMQINTSWLPRLSKYGYEEVHLYDKCTNVNIAAWILANNAAQYGWNWNAIGAYNVGCKALNKKECEARRNRYAMKVYRALYGRGGASVETSSAPMREQVSQATKIVLFEVSSEAAPSRLAMASDNYWHEQ